MNEATQTVAYHNHSNIQQCRDDTMAASRLVLSSPSPLFLASCGYANVLPTPRPPQRQRPAARCAGSCAPPDTANIQHQHDTARPNYFHLGRRRRRLDLRIALREALLPSRSASSQSLLLAFKIEKLPATQAKKEGDLAIAQQSATGNGASKFPIQRPSNG